jgi:short-subunit dehydrogenase
MIRSLDIFHCIRANSGSHTQFPPYAGTASIGGSAFLPPEGNQMTASIMLSCGIPRSILCETGIVETARWQGKKCKPNPLFFCKRNDRRSDSGPIVATVRIGMLFAAYPAFARAHAMKIKLKKLSDQVIVMTGATSGIGLATARKAARCGARLVLVARNEEALKLLSEDLNSHGTETMYIAADVANEDEVRRVAEAVIQRFGGFDTWMNVAGVGIFGKIEEVAVEDMRRLFDVNFWGVVHGSLAAIPHLKSRGGALINVGSETSDRAIPLQGIYSASKHAVKGFTDSLRVELEEEGAPVSVTLVKPASINTMFVEHAKNYLEVEPKLPPPVYSPEIVADALLYAAEHPTRDMYIGSRARLMKSAAHHMPGLLDKGMQRFIYRLMKSEKPPRDRDDNSLYTYRTDLLERGGFDSHTRETSLYTSAVTHPRAANAAVLGAGLVLAAIWQARHRRQARSVSATG